MNAMHRYPLAVAALAMAAQASGQVTFYEHQGFRGASITVDRPVGDLGRLGFGGVASSAVVAGETSVSCAGRATRSISIRVTGSELSPQPACSAGRSFGASLIGRWISAAPTASMMSMYQTQS